MNILIKLTCLIGLVIAPILGGHTTNTEIETESVQKKEVKQIEIEKTITETADMKVVASR